MGEWKSDQRSLYKCVLLNVRELRRLGVEYQKDLHMYEDVFLVHEVLRAGGKTLKCLKFCFRASHCQSGGCDEQRQRTKADGTRMDDLIDRSKYQELAVRQREALSELHQWISGK